MQIPDKLTMVEAAAIPEVWLTAFTLLDRVGKFVFYTVTPAYLGFSVSYPNWHVTLFRLNHTFKKKTIMF